MDSDDQQAADTNASWLARFRASQAVTSGRDHDPTFGTVFVRGEGSRLWDVEGTEWLDLTCGYSATNFGHAYPPLVAAAKQQLSELIHLTGQPHVGRIALAERLIDVLGQDFDAPKVIFNSTGARAVETALKAAMSFRPGKIVSLAPGFHGRSMATLPLGQSLIDNMRFAFSEPTVAWPQEHYPYCARCPHQLTHPACNVRCADPLFTYLQENASDISCVIVEPALGARGYVFPPADFFQRIRAITSRFGILMIADEIQTGLGRCGDWLASRVQGWEPDLIVIGKSLAGGITPVSATLGASHLLDSIPQGAESETFAATPFACAIALRAIECLLDGELFERGREIGGRLRKFVLSQAMQNGLPPVLVEGLGASCAIEFGGQAGNARSLEQSLDRARVFALACHAQRLRVHLTGPVGTRVVLLPALTMANEELDLAMHLLSNAMRDATH